jgi:hypothetical protein
MRERAAQTELVEKEPQAAATALAAPEQPLLELQRKVGNAGVVAMLAEQGIQPKMRVGAVNDPAEAEADRLAAQVVQSFDAGPAAGPGDVAPDPRLARKVRRRSDKGGGDAPNHGFEGGPVDTGVEQAIDAARGGGSAMAPEVRSKMEGAFGADFGGVRIHSGGQADGLSRSLNAEAFTTGSDVFFAAGKYNPTSTSGQTVLAHELAHTVQQGAAVRRFVSPKDFAARTDEGMFTTKGPAQKEIEKQLAAYAALGAVTEDKSKTKGKKKVEAPKEKVVIPDNKLDNAIALLQQMKSIADMWIKAKTIDAPDGKNAMIDPSRAKRGAGMAWFIMVADGELESLKARRDAKVAEGTAQDEVVVDSKGMAKLKEKYEGSLQGGLLSAGSILGKAVSTDGDSTEFEMDLKIPVSPGVFVGAILRFEAKKDGATEVACEALFQAGGSVGIGDVHGALGGYFKAGAKTPEGAIKLLSYGFYRRCKESSVIPNEVSSMIWGGNSGAFGKKKAEDWSLQVEKDELGDDESYVETGGVAEVGADLDLGVAELGVSAKGTAGKRHDKKSLTDAKQGPGEKNTGPILGRGAQDTTGRSTAGLELSSKATVLSILNGDVKLALSWRDAGGTTGIVLEQMEIQGRVSGRVPATGLESKIVGLVASFSKTLRTVFGSQFEKAKGAMQKGKTVASPAVSLSKSIADTTLEAVEGMPLTDYLKANTLDKIMEPDAAAEGASTATDGASEGLTSESQVGLELAFNYNDSNGTKTSTLEVRHLSAMTAKVPALIKAELVRRTRILGARSVNGGSWTFI